MKDIEIKVKGVVERPRGEDPYLVDLTVEVPALPIVAAILGAGLNVGEGLRAGEKEVPWSAITWGAINEARALLEKLE